jgi:opacity protein-like surface antigen
MWHNSASNMKRGYEMLKRAGIALAVTIFLTSFFLASTALAQDGRFDAGINGGEVFTNTASGNSVVQSATAGLNVFGTIRYKFKSKHSLLFNYGRSRNSQTYQSGDNFHVLNSISEISGAYMFSPMPNRKLEPFFLAGGGVLIFSPSSTWVVFPNLPDNVMDRVQVNLGASSQTKLAFLYGLGVDYKLPMFSRLSLRLQYRGFLYKAPDFNVDQNSGSQVNFFTGGKEHMAEPSIGFVFRF